jgi:hypothetical protein
VLLTFAILLTALPAGVSQSVPADLAKSKVTVLVFRSGLFSAFAHNHQIAAPLSGGTIDPTARQLQLRFDVRRMQVLDPEASSSDRSQIQATMLSDKVLDAERFPEITFTSQRIVSGANGGYTVEGQLNLHGVSRKLIVPVSAINGRYVGTVTLKQTEFGITPVKVFGGTVKAKDQVQITFEVVPGLSGEVQ